MQHLSLLAREIASVSYTPPLDVSENTLSLLGYSPSGLAVYTNLPTLRRPAIYERTSKVSPSAHFIQRGIPASQYLCQDRWNGLSSENQPRGDRADRAPNGGGGRRGTAI